jgi:hypothetical protein
MAASLAMLSTAGLAEERYTLATWKTERKSILNKILSGFDRPPERFLDEHLRH